MPPPTPISASPTGIGPFASLPASYPNVINTPPDRAYLRPLQHWLFDTEWLMPDSAISQSLNFFTSPRGSPFQHRFDRGKTRIDTNMIQSGELVAPDEFSIIIFYVVMPTSISSEDYSAIVDEGSFTFSMCGRQPYIDAMPLRPFVTPINPEYLLPRMPANTMEKMLEEIKTMCAESAIITSAGQNNEEQKDRVAALLEDLMPSKIVATVPGHKFTLGRAALKIKPGERFNVTLEWNEPVKVSKPVRLVAGIGGLLWRPL